MKNNVILRINSLKKEILEDNLKDYSIPGVWAIYGKEKGNEVLLEVGATLNIAEELESAKYSILYPILKGEFSYTAKRLFDFSKSFEVTTNDVSKKSKENSARYHAKYREISNFDEVIIYFLLEEEDADKRFDFEMKYAIDNRALFWNAWNPQKKEAIKYYKETKNNKQEVSIVDKFIQVQLKITPNADEKILAFIGNIKFHQGQTSEPVIHSLFADGYCYYFALMLKDAFKGEIMWHKYHSHIVFKSNDLVYDIDGVFLNYENDDEIVPISEIDIEAEKIGRLYDSGLESFRHRR